MPVDTLMWENPNLVHFDVMKGGYRFYESSMTIECFILAEALLELSHRKTAREDEFFWIFRNHRHRIWEAAQRKASAGRFEFDGSLILKHADF